MSALCSNNVMIGSLIIVWIVNILDINSIYETQYV
jgi:hypothetical protein